MFGKQIFPLYSISFQNELSFQMLWSPAACTASWVAATFTVSLWVSRNVSSPWPLRFGCRSAPLKRASHVLCQESFHVHADIVISFFSSTQSTWHKLPQPGKAEAALLLFCHTLLNQARRKNPNNHERETKPRRKNSVLSSVRQKSSQNWRQSGLPPSKLHFLAFRLRCAPFSFSSLK